MADLQTAFTRLVGCPAPLQSVGIPGIATPALCAAVSDAGGLGMVSGSLLPAAGLIDLLERVGRATAAPFGVNFLMPFLDLDCVDAAATRARVVEFFYGEPDATLVARVHAGGALAAWQTGSLAEAERAAAAGCDFIIAQGVEAGGHVRGVVGTLQLLAQVLDRVRIPVLAAGGVGSARGLAAVLAAGGAGVRVGTRFVAAAESAAHEDYVARLVAARPEDTVLTEAFSVLWPDAPHRVLRSAVAAAQALPDGIVGTAPVNGQVLEIQRLSVFPPTRGATGHVEAMALYAGESVAAIDRVQPAGGIVREIVDGARSLLGAGPA